MAHLGDSDGTMASSNPRASGGGEVLWGLTCSWTLIFIRLIFALRLFLTLRLLTLHVSDLILCVKISYFKSYPCTVQVLEGAEGQYSGMQIGQLQDEEDEAANILQDDSSESFRNSSLGMLINTGVGQTGDTIKTGVQVHLHFQGNEDSCNRSEK